MMRPSILINCPIDVDRPTSRILMAYSDAVLANGGLPFIAVAYQDADAIEAALDRVQGVVFVGGPDYHPDAYGGRPQSVSELMDRRRHESDLLLARAVLARRLPVLGICGGMQLMVIAQGGGLIQDIHDECLGALDHRTAAGATATRHLVRLTNGTRLHKLVAATDLTVNSYHHQAPRPSHHGAWQICAQAPDGVIEAIEDPDHSFRIGVQWHPERMMDCSSSQALFGGLVAASRSLASDI